METTDLISEPVLSPACPKCQGIIRITDTFCGHCGHALTLTLADPGKRGDVFERLAPTLVYYFITLVFLCLYKLTAIFPEGFEGLMMITIIDVAIVVAFWGNYFQSLRPLFSLRGLSLKIMTLTILGAIAGSVVVSIVAALINITIQDDVFYSTYLFEDTKYPFLFATLFIAVQPAIFEEVAFRGFLFNNLRTVTPAKSTVYITAFVFGIIHLNIISLLWLIPLGLALAFMRNKYNTLWYGMVAHFTYNLSITIFDFLGWF